MTQFAKAKWSTDGDTLRMGMDISKVDKVGRMVYGWATVDNVDTDGDVVTAEASADAFARSRMNLREMHKSDSAVGRVVSFKEDEFRAPDGNTHKGIFVKVYVSKGAEETWQKVLDKTLNGFSIGGEVIEAEEVFQKDLGKTGRVVKKYNLNELSLVDNPGNQYSDITNVFKIHKSADGSVTSVTGLIEDQKVLNVFYCSNDELTQEKPDETQSCPVCDAKMENIGFVENSGERAEKVNALVTKFRGGDTMTFDSLIKSSTVDPDDLETVATGNDPDDKAEVPLPAKDEQDAEPVVEVEDAESEISKQIDSLKTNVETILNKSNQETKEEIAKLQKAVESATEDFKNKTSEFEQKLNELDENLKLTKARLTKAETGLEKVNSKSALKKSADSDVNTTQPAVEQNDPWEGSALDVRSAFSISQYL
jgi:hypothetical protein